MQVGIDSFAAAFDENSRAVNPAERLRQLVQQIEHADEVGLDAFGVGEHHRREFLDSAPAVILGAAAARTQRIRLTSAVTVLSAEDPVRAFQNFATLDLLSKGRAEMIEGTVEEKAARLAQIIKDLNVYLIGWRGYFGFCETPSVLRELDKWIRRRLRAIVWEQWKRGPTRFVELRRRGVGPALAAKSAGSPRGPWRLSNSPALSIAISNAVLKSRGLATVEVPKRA